MMRRYFAAVSVAALVACGQPNAPAAAPGAVDAAADAPDDRTILNVYSARPYESDKAMYGKFEEETGTKINVVEASAPQLLETLKAEGANGPADVIIISDAGTLYLFQLAGMTKPTRSDVLEAAIPQQLREKDGNWFGLAKRARIIVYDPQLLPLEEVDTYADLAEDRLKG